MQQPDMGERTARLKMLLALEVDRIVNDLLERQEFLLTMWSRHRTREPFLDTTFSRWRTLSMGDLALLDPDSITAVQRFFDELENFRMYVRYTEDMPTTLEERFAVRFGRLDRLGEGALRVLGGVPAPLDGMGSIPLPIPPPAPTTDS